jgi:hypothetical protein
MSNFVDKLDKKRPESQTVISEVEFLSDITVPTASLILGKDGARIGSSARALSYTDARERNTLFSQYYYDDTGGTVLSYWDIAVRQTLNVCPDSGVTLSDPQELPFSGAVGNTLTRAFKIIPKTSGTLRVQSWEGVDDTGAVLIDSSFTILVGDIDNLTLIDLPIGLISEVGDLQFVRFSGVQLSGSLSQSSGIFIGQECPYLDSDVHLLTIKEVVTTQIVGTVSPHGVVNGVEGDVYLFKSGRDSTKYLFKNTIAGNDSWYRYTNPIILSGKPSDIEQSMNMNSGESFVVLEIVPETDIETFVLVMDNNSMPVGQTCDFYVTIFNQDGDTVLKEELLVIDSTVIDSFEVDFSSLFESYANEGVLVAITANNYSGQGVISLKKIKAKQVNQDTIIFKKSGVNGVPSSSDFTTGRITTNDVLFWTGFRR